MEILETIRIGDLIQVVIGFMALATKLFTFYDALSVLLQQSSLVKPVKQTSARVFWTAWGIVTILLTTYYSAKFLAFAAVPPKTADIASIAQLVDAVGCHWGMEVAKGDGGIEYIILTFDLQLTKIHKWCI